VKIRIVEFAEKVWRRWMKDEAMDVVLKDLNFSINQNITIVVRNVVRDEPHVTIILLSRLWQSTKASVMP
jgi:hypothetical protein